MGLLGGLLGDAGVDLEALQEELELLLLDGEGVETAAWVGDDLLVLTTARILEIDNSGPRRRRVQYVSTPYRSVRRFAIETHVALDRDATLGLWIAGESAPAEYSLARGADLRELQRVLAHYVCAGSRG